MAGVAIQGTAQAGNRWGVESPEVLASVKNQNALSGLWRCSGAAQAVVLDGYTDVVQACVHGGFDGIRIARTHTGGTLYHVAFPGDQTFYELRGVCENHISCSYGHGADALLTHSSASGGHAVVYQQFSQKIKKKYDLLQMKPYVEYATGEARLEVRAGSLAPRVESFAVSQNGRWALVETEGYGTLRVQLETGDIRRILSGGSGGAYHSETAITDDGATVVSTGWNKGLHIYDVGSGCGDRLTQDSQPLLRFGSIPCKHSPLDPYELYPGFSSGYWPRFIDATTLSLVVYKADGGYSTVLGYKQGGVGGALEYLALGDSFTSGEGETNDAYYSPGTNVGDHKCHASSRAYPHLLALAWSVEHRSVACSGARTVDVIGGDGYKGQGGRLKSIQDESLESIRGNALTLGTPGIVEQLAFVTRHQPLTVSVGIGGNDAGLMAKLSTCIMKSTCVWAKDPAAKAATAEEIRSIYTPLRDMYQRIKNASPRSKIFVIGYPSIINNSNSAACGAVLSTVLNKDERQFIDEAVRYLNKVVKAAASAERLEYIDIETALDGARLCDANSAPGMSAIRLGDDIAPFNSLPSMTLFGAESFHPTPEGHRRIAEAIRTKIPNVLSAQPCECQVEQYSNTEPMHFWGEPVGYRQVPLVASVRTQTVDNGTSLVVRSSKGLFQPGSSISVKFDAEPIIESRVIAEADGTVEVTLASRGIAAGIYSLRLAGNSLRTLEPIEAYDTVSLVRSTAIPPIDHPLDAPVQIEAEVSEKTAPSNPSSYSPMPTHPILSTALSSPKILGGVASQAPPRPVQFTVSPHEQNKHSDNTTIAPYVVAFGVIVLSSIALVTFHFFRLRQN